jgi:hypothetical protein
MPACPSTAARRVGDELPDLAEGETFGYGVDSGTGCFVDDVTATRFFELMDGRKADAFGKKLLRILQRCPAGNSSWGEASVPGARGNLILFSSGRGDGIYTSWFGYDEQGRLVSLVTEFDVLRRDEDIVQEDPPAPQHKRWWEFWK